MTCSTFRTALLLAAALLVAMPGAVRADGKTPARMPLPVAKPDPESTFNLTPKAKLQFVEACTADGQPVAVCTCLINGIEAYIPPLDFVKFGLAQKEGRDPDPATGARIDRIYQACVARTETEAPASPEGGATDAPPPAGGASVAPGGTGSGDAAPAAPGTAPSPAAPGATPAPAASDAPPRKP